MSEQHISAKSSSDFSIARILSNDVSPNPKNKSRINNEIIRLNDEKISLNNKSRENQEEETERKENYKLKEIERPQPGDLNSQDFINQEKNQKPEFLERELPWLRCTRYSPPKLPRRPGVGKQAKRRLGSHPRIPFTKVQIQVLEEKYRISAYLSRRDVIQLAENLSLPQNRVSVSGIYS